MLSMSENQSMQKPEQRDPQAVTARPESLWQPFATLRGEVDRLFDNFWGGAGGALRRALPDAPAIDLVEAQKEFRIKAELPGMDAKDVELALSEDMLTIKGEKKDEREEKTENHHLSERRFGSFSRSFQLPRGVDRDKIEASFQKGVLTVTLPKTAESTVAQRKIGISQKG